MGWLKVSYILKWCKEGPLTLIGILCFLTEKLYLPTDVQALKCLFLRMAILSFSEAGIYTIHFVTKATPFCIDGKCHIMKLEGCTRSI